jgi:hypothetical protein
MPLEEALATLAALKDDEHIPLTVLAKKKTVVAAQR